MLAKKCLFVGTLTLLSLSLAIAAPPAVHPKTGEPLVIDCLRGTPEAIDGDLSDWNLEAMTPAALDTAEQLHSGQASWTGPEDSSGEFYLLWDDLNIYIAVVVKDDKLSMNKSGSSIWNADAIEVFFSTTNAVAGHAEHYQYGFNANNQRWNWCNIDGAGQSEPDYLQIASSLTADGYICEASIEYGKMLSLDFSAGNTIGFHPVFDDTDNGDRELQMTWTGREAHDQSQGFGHMFLSSEAAPPAGANIAWVTETCDDDADGVQDDQAWIDWLTAEGHTVDLRPDYWLELDPNKVDELNATDLVIVSRSATSGGYDEGDEPALWNSVTSPLLTLNAYLARNNRWLWMNTDTVEHSDAILMAVDTSHPVFDGVTFEMENMVVLLDNTVGTGLSTFIVGTDVGNGTLIAQALGNDWTWIAEWPAGVEFYAGSGHIAGGPRMVLVAGTEEIVGSAPQGAWNLTAEGEKIFRNAIAYMLPAAEEPGPAPVGHWQFDEGSGTIAADSSGSGLDGTISGAEWVSPGSDGTGFCLDFDGLGTDRVSLGTFDVIGDGISIACWYKADNLDTPGNDPRLFSKAIGGASEEHWFMVSSSRVNGEKRLRFRLKTDGATGELKAGPDGTMELDAWTHVVASWDGETMRLHKNGVEVGSLAKGGTLSTDPTVKVSIGNQPEGAEDRPWDGLIDDVRVYNIGLSQAEIDAIVSVQ